MLFSIARDVMCVTNIRGFRLKMRCVFMRQSLKDLWLDELEIRAVGENQMTMFERTSQPDRAA